MSAGNQAKSSAWEETTLGHLGRLHCGQSPPSPTVNTSGRGVPYVSGPEQWDGFQIHQSKWTTAPARQAPENSIFITVKGAGVGTIFPGVEAAIGRDIYAFEPHSCIDTRFIYHAIQYSVRHVIAKAHGDIPGLSKDHILDHPISVPGPKTQHSVGAKVDELFSRIEDGEQALQRAQKLVEQYRQSVLKGAVTGELTRVWRERKGKLESGGALVARILKSRRDAWEKAEFAKMVAKAPKPINDLWKKKYKEPAVPNTTNLPVLPDGWVWASLEQIGDVTGGLTKNEKRRELETKRPYLRVANVYANRLDLSDVQEIGLSGAELDRVTLKKGDLLVVEGNGSIEQIGRVALWDGSIQDCVHQNHIIKVRFDREALAKYALIWCMSPGGRSVIQNIASSTAGLHTLSISKVGSLPIPIPTEGELEVIEDEFERMNSLATAQKQEIASALAASSALRNAALKNAFRGELVPQSSGDEPASVLLERIAAERGATLKTFTTAKGRRKKLTA